MRGTGGTNTAEQDICDKVQLGAVLTSDPPTPPSFRKVFKLPDPMFSTGFTRHSRVVLCARFPDSLFYFRARVRER